MQHSGALYTLGFAAAVCVVCAVLVSSSAYFLQGPQERNKLLERQQQVLRVTGLAERGESLSAAEVQRRFEASIEKRFVNLETGQALTAEEFQNEVGLDPRTYDAREARTNPDLSVPAPPDNGARITTLPKYAVVYYVLEGETVDQVVLPITGKGLWSTMYGFLALDKDGRTIHGLTFYEHGETPGLGGEVDNPKWKAQWEDRKAYDENWNPEIHVIKGQAGPPEEAPYEVDGLSGATLTSRGVSDLVQFWLSDDGFKPFLEQFRNQGSAA
ncbi:MAG: Na(+)-translocating NADH-quinone reductase subunit C [Candidatus Hydrogenedentota bacterium]